MKMPLKAMSLMLLVASIVAPGSAWAFWIPDGVVVSAATGAQMNTAIAPDGARGALVAWVDTRLGGWDIYTQKISSSGTALWTANGVAVCTATGYQYGAVVVSDGAGGAIIAWHDPRAGSSNNDIYAQRVSSSGAVLWTTDGVAICTATGDQTYPALLADGAGGVFITWQDNRSGTYADIYAQRVNASGVVQWATDGVALCAFPLNQTSPMIVSDGAGGAIVTWMDARNVYSYGWDIYAQRIDASGAVQWVVDGVHVCGAGGSQLYPRIVSDDAGGAVIAWQDDRNGTWDIYAQRLSGAGAFLWATDGIALCTAAGMQQYPRIEPDGSHGAVVVWDDSRSGNHDIYAQRATGAGSVPWMTNGVALSAAPGDQSSPVATSDGAGGAIVTWNDYRTGPFADIYTQRVDVSGVVRWTPDGVAVCALAESQISPAIATDDARGAIIAWGDQRIGGVSDLYAQCIDAKGRPGYHGASILSITDVPGDQGGWVRIDVAASSLDDAQEPLYPAITYNVWQRIDDPALLQAAVAKGRRVARAGDLGETGTFPPGSWELLGSFAAYQQFDYTYRASTVADSMESGVVYSVYMVSVHTTTPSVWFASDPDSGWSVDNIAPGVPPGLLVAYNTGSGNRLMWGAVADRDFQYFRIYRGPDPGFTPGPAYLAGSMPFPRWQDPEYDGWDVHYKVTAVDHAGNESAPASPMATTGTDTNGAPPSFALHQNAPNPFNPETTIRYDVPSGGGRVRMRIFDVSGRLVRTLVDEAIETGGHTVVWDGRNDSGRKAESGVYFYQMTAPGFAEIRKMILLR